MTGRDTSNITEFHIGRENSDYAPPPARPAAAIELPPRHNPDQRNFQLALRIGVYGLKTALMVNALAAGAFLILTNFSRSVPDYIEALAWFGIAALLTIIGFAIGYCCRLPYPGGLDGTPTHRDGKPAAARGNALADFIAMLAITAIAGGASGALSAGI